MQPASHTAPQWWSQGGNPRRPPPGPGPLPSAAGSLPPMVGLGPHSGQSVPVLRPVKETHVDVGKRQGRSMGQQAESPEEDGDLQLPQIHVSAKTTLALSRRGCRGSDRQRGAFPHCCCSPLPSSMVTCPCRYKNWGVSLQNLLLECPEHLAGEAAGHGGQGWDPEA